MDQAMTVDDTAIINALRKVKRTGRAPDSRRMIETIVDLELGELIGGGCMDLTEKGGALLDHSPPAEDRESGT
jgi:hypothetical protein